MGLHVLINHHRFYRLESVPTCVQFKILDVLQFRGRRVHLKGGGGGARSWY